MAKGKNNSKKCSMSGTKKKGKKKEKVKDMSKVRCFYCQKMGQYVVTCLNNKKKGVATLAEVDELSTKLDKDFYLVISVATSVTSSTVCTLTVESHTI